MEDALFSFPANPGSDQIFVYLGLIAFILGGVATVYLLRQKGPRETYNRRMLTAMLVFFLAMLGAGTGLFSYLSMQKMSTVEIFSDRLVTGYGEVALTDIKNAKIETAGRSSLVDPGRFSYETKLLIIEEQNGKAHVLPDEIYNIQAILDAMRQTLKTPNK